MADSKSGGKSSPSRKTVKRSSAKPSVVLADLRRGVTDSDSVRLLQKKLNVQSTGTYDGSTQAAVRAWQNDNGFVGGRGRGLDEQQASRLFGNDATLASDAS